MAKQGDQQEAHRSSRPGQWRAKRTGAHEWPNKKVWDASAGGSSGVEASQAAAVHANGCLPKQPQAAAVYANGCLPKRRLARTQIFPKELENIGADAKLGSSKL